jgi:NAD(P)-dependent dehydrogenase (short-subunit alcohol dehydrogenase family)
MNTSSDIALLPTTDYRPRSEAFASCLFVLANIGAGAGAALARRLAVLGARTVLTDPSIAVLEEADDAIREAGGIPPLLHAIDPLGATVADYEDLAEAVALEGPTLDGLVVDCGYVGYHGPFLTHPPEQWFAILRTHLDAAFAITQAFLAALSSAPRSSVIYTTSEDGRKPRAFAGAHAVAHAGLETLARIEAEEYAHRGRPRFHTLDPGEVSTALRREFFPGRAPGEDPPPETIVEAYLELLDPAVATPFPVACRAVPRPASDESAVGKGRKGS